MNYLQNSLASFESCRSISSPIFLYCSEKKVKNQLKEEGQQLLEVDECIFERRIDCEQQQQQQQQQLETAFNASQCLQEMIFPSCCSLSLSLSPLIEVAAAAGVSMTRPVQKQLYFLRSDSAAFAHFSLSVPCVPAQVETGRAGPSRQRRYSAILFQRSSLERLFCGCFCNLPSKANSAEIFAQAGPAEKGEEKGHAELPSCPAGSHAGVLAPANVHNSFRAVVAAEFCTLQSALPPGLEDSGELKGLLLSAPSSTTTTTTTRTTLPSSAWERSIETGILFLFAL